MATRKTWTVRPFQPGQDDAGVARLLMSVATFDGSVAAWTEQALKARLAHPGADGGSGWRVAIANNAVVGALLVAFVGTLRTEIVVAVNPAFRRQGIGRALLEEAPARRRLLCTSRESVPAATALLTSAGFLERYRSVVLRREAAGVKRLEPDDGMRVLEDGRNDARRAVAALVAVLGEDADDDRAWMKLRLARPRCKALYLEVPDDAGGFVDGGICIVAPCDRAKKGERTASGEAVIGVIEDVGLTRAMRGKGLSRLVVRAGMRAVQDAGFRVIEASADKRRAAAVELYQKEGFDAVDEEIHWMRREDGPAPVHRGRT
jgi:ribosomal protein S18 acetylase RimI-like enzyme